MEKDTKTEQITMNLSATPQRLIPKENGGDHPINVFRPEDSFNHRKDRIRQHKMWLDTLQREYPMPSTPWRIGVYIRYFNQTKYEDYLDYHKKQFQDTIALCPLWTLEDFYVDQGQSAPNMENAQNWCRLLKDCFSGRVNLIITQKVSNVTRKPGDITLIARILASLPEPVGIYFISENLFTLASYYRQDLNEPGFLPEGLNPLPDGVETEHLGAEPEETPDDE